MQPAGILTLPAVCCKLASKLPVTGQEMPMERSEAQEAEVRRAQLKSRFQVEVIADWKEAEAEWQPGTWTIAELDKLQDVIALMANIIGGPDRFVRELGGVTVRKADIGTHGGEALAHRVSFPLKGSFTPWTVVHEFAHAWDANQGWKLSRLLEKYTRGFTSPALALLKQLVRMSDSAFLGPEKVPGRYGRMPGCNRAGYFYGDRPSGSNWSFNRKEDFAESVAMFVGWERGNALSEHARNRIIRYRLQNGEKDPFNVVDNWMDYARIFYPDNGDYTKTQRWQFVDELIHGRIAIRS
jgi:hypothetical protein